jgi:hypothetical protein
VEPGGAYRDEGSAHSFGIVLAYACSQGATMTMFSWHDLLYVMALLSGGLLVLGSTLGLAELEADADADAAGGGDGLLALLGVGRVPTTVVLLLLALIFGGSGLALGPICRALLGASAGPHVGLGLALLTAFGGTAVLGRVLARVLPRTESYASGSRDLLGATGRVIAIGRGGAAILAVIDAGGAELRLRARIDAGDVRAGSEVVITRYDAQRDLYFANPKLTAVCDGLDEDPNPNSRGDVR